jgi:hypothetical protein
MAPVDLKLVLLTALLNPGVFALAFWLGRRADQWQKIPVAAFAAGLVGSVLVYFLISFGMLTSLARAVAGVFTANILFGLVWAIVGYLTRGWPRRSP